MSDRAVSGEERVRHCYRHPDRETLVACSHCDRPICTECMTTAAVGIRCPQCAGGGRGSRPAVAARMALQGGGITATVSLVVLNCIVFLAQALQAPGMNDARRTDIVVDGGVSAGFIADGELYRLVTAGFIHAGLTHILFNMWALWVLGGVLERAVGTARMLVIYAASVLWGSAGALLLSPHALTVGASGGVFGIIAALLVASRHRGMEMLGSGIGALLLVNLGITFVIPGISIGGHLGGLAGGAATAFVLAGLGRGHIAYGRVKPALWVGCGVILAGAVAVAVVASRAAVG